MAMDRKIPKQAGKRHGSHTHPGLGMRGSMFDTAKGTAKRAFGEKTGKRANKQGGMLHTKKTQIHGKTKVGGKSY